MSLLLVSLLVFLYALCEGYRGGVKVFDWVGRMFVVVVFAYLTNMDKEWDVRILYSVLLFTLVWRGSGNWFRRGDPFLPAKNDKASISREKKILNYNILAVIVLLTINILIQYVKEFG